MPPMTITRLRERIGDMGLPRAIWIVRSYVPTGHVTTDVGFYDRDKAAAYADADDGRRLLPSPILIEDASCHD